MKLTGWKTKVLSRVTQTILIRSTLLTILIYAMQMVKLLTSAIQQLEKICSGFFWGFVDRKRQLYSIAWSNFRCPKAKRCLGIPNLSALNMALLAKLAWKLGKFSQSLCNQVLHAKYGGWQTIVLKTPLTGCSLYWRRIITIASVMREVVSWIIEDSKSVLFWFDSRLYMTPLISSMVVSIPTSHYRHTVRDYWDSTRGWNYAEIIPLLPSSILHDLEVVRLTNNPQSGDMIYWKLTSHVSLLHNLSRNIWKIKLVIICNSTRKSLEILGTSENLSHPVDGGT